MTYCGGGHEDHDEKHDVTSKRSGFSVHDPNCRIRSNLSFFHIDHVDIVSSGMDPVEDVNVS